MRKSVTVWARRNVPTMSQVLSWTAHLLPKHLRRYQTSFLLRAPSNIVTPLETSPVGNTHGRWPRDHPREVAQRSPTGGGPEINQRPGGVITSWCAPCRIIWNCCWPWDISSPPWIAPTILSRVKAGMKMNWQRCVIFRYCNPLLLFIYFSKQYVHISRHLSSLPAWLHRFWCILARHCSTTVNKSAISK